MAEYLIETDEQICHELEISGTIIHREDGYSFQVLPGCLRIALDDPDIGDFLCKELQTTELDEFEPYMWLKAKQDRKHISSLTEQIVRGRNITIIEKPRLHLVWAYDRFFIKPLPIYLLSRPLCDHFLLSHDPYISPSVQEDLRRAASGLIRLIFVLIQHESDFIIAQDEKTRLILGETSYADFARFTQLFYDRLDRMPCPVVSTSENYD